MPPCALSPLTVPPMPCSRTPKKTLRPECSAVNRPDSGNTVIVEVVRSAAPPTIVGVNGSKAAMVLPPATRVESFSFSQSVGSASPSPGRGRPCQARSHSRARSGSSPRQRANRSFHSACAWAPSCTMLKVSYTPSGTKKVLAGSQPMTSLVNATSSSPSAEPWALLVPDLLGDG